MFIFGSGTTGLLIKQLTVRVKVRKSHQTVSYSKFSHINQVIYSLKVLFLFNTSTCEILILEYELIITPCVSVGCSLTLTLDLLSRLQTDPALETFSVF